MTSKGRLLGRSPLIGDLSETYLSRGRTPEHAASEADRLLARPSEFQNTPIAVSGIACWRDWFRAEINAHDGLIGRAHPRLRKVFDRPMSATSLKLLLRDPIRFVWRYALGWKQPDPAEEPLTLDPLAFGNLVHGVLEKAVNILDRCLHPEFIPWAARYFRQFTSATRALLVLVTTGKVIEL